jgi:hypothetical protein
MANEVTAIDPLGKTIYLLPGIFFTENKEQEIYDDAAMVIKKPAMLIEVKEKNEAQFYYIRSVGWNNTLLLTVRLNNNRWEAYNCIKNPPGEMLATVLKKGKQII